MTKPYFTKHYKADYKDEYIFLVVIINCDAFKYTVFLSKKNSTDWPNRNAVLLERPGVAACRATEI